MSESDRPSGDRRVLEELEQFQRAIRAVRAGHDRAGSGAGLRRGSDLAIRPRPAPAPAVPPVAIVAADEIPAGSRVSAGAAAVRQRWGRGPLSAAVAALAVAALGGAWAMNRTPAASPPTVQAQPAAAPEPVASPPIQPIDPHALRVDLTTLRTVWLRVSVDGRIAIEREVAAGEQLPFGADRSIVVRAGDAGAVTVRVGGVDQGAIGRDGQVVTRAFEAPAR
jgi:Domain of unknown function (DUF4115)